MGLASGQGVCSSHPLTRRPTLPSLLPNPNPNPNAPPPRRRRRSLVCGARGSSDCLRNLRSSCAAATRSTAARHTSAPLHAPSAPLYAPLHTLSAPPSHPSTPPSEVPLRTPLRDPIREPSATPSRPPQFPAPCLHEWGLSMDDALVLANLRNLSCVKGVDWPPKVRENLEVGRVSSS